MSSVKYNRSHHPVSTPSNCNSISFGLQTQRLNPQFSLLILIGCLLLGGGGVSCSSLAQLGSQTITIGNQVFNVTKIGEIQGRKTPSSSVVYLRGKVIHQAPFLQAGAYQLQDDTGSIWVVTRQPLPPVGQTLLIEGKVQFQSIPIANQELGETYVEEQKQLEQQS